MIKKYFFFKKTYPAFIAELKKNWELNKIVLLWVATNDSLEIAIALNDKIIIMKKNREQDLIKKIINLEHFKEIEFNLLNNYILSFKEKASIIDALHIIENFDTKLRDSIVFYKIKSQEIREIYQSILEENSIFLDNSPPVIVDDNANNKWID